MNASGKPGPRAVANLKLRERLTGCQRSLGLAGPWLRLGRAESDREVMNPWHHWHGMICQCACRGKTCQWGENIHAVNHSKS